MKKEETYAVKSYLFGKNYVDLKDTILDSFVRTSSSIKETYEKIFHPGSEYIIGNIGLVIFYIFLLIARLIFGILFTVIFSIVHILIVTLMMIGVYIVFVTIAFIDKVYRLFRRISNNCPSCQRKYDLPVYHCPNCGAPHRYLFPSRYGIFYHKCSCGTKLPTLLINGRHKLDGSCPHCGAPSFKGLNHSTIFPVFGGRSCGKTCFINSAISQIEEMAPELNVDFAYFYGVAHDDRMNIKTRMDSGYLPDSTHENSLTFYNFTFTPKGKQRIHNFISVCDINGETFNSREKISKQIGYKYADSIIFVLDPLSMTEFRNEAINQGYDVQSYAYSDQEMSDLLSNMLTTLENMNRKKTKPSLVVAFTKCDLDLVEQYLGNDKIKAYQKQHKLSFMEARDAIAEDFLKQFGEFNALKLIQNYFSSVHYFTTSATGKDHVDGEKFDSFGTAYPLLWAIDVAYTNLNFNKNIWRKEK